MRRTLLLVACAGALAATLMLAAAAAPRGAAFGVDEVGSAFGAAEAEAAPGAARARATPAAARAGTTSVAARASAARPAKRFRAGYLRWRGRLQRHDLYVGRDLLPRVRAADGSARPPTRRELRRSIHRMQRRWARFTRTTRRGRNAMFKLKVRRAVPRWGKQHLRSIRSCESRNNPRAVGGGGSFRGLYQFTISTWYVVGGKGDPATAVRHEQTWRAWLLLSRHGAGHWPVCG